MKKTINLLPFILLCLFGGGLQAQILSVASGTAFNVKAGTVLSGDKLQLTPSTDFTLNGSSLSQSGTVLDPTNIPHINRVYKFSAPTNAFSGSVRFYYSNADLNGLSESSLQLLMHNGSSWSLNNSSTVNTAEKYVQNASVNGAVLKEITAGTCAPNTGDSTASACGSFTWYGTTYTASANPTHTLTNAGGCDSVVTLHLTVNSLLQAPVISGNASFCAGGSSVLGISGSHPLVFNGDRQYATMNDFALGTLRCTIVSA